MKTTMLIMTLLILVSCGKGSNSSSSESVSVYPVKSELSQDEKQIVDFLLKKGEVEEKVLLRELIKFKGAGGMNEITLERLSTHITVECMNGRCHIMENK